MAATGTPTTNLGLRRPQGTDPASVDDINYNSELIDTKMGPVGNTSVQEQINTLNSKLGNTQTKIAQSVASNSTYELSIEDNHSYLITHMTSSDESTRVILISRRATYVRLFELAKGSWQSYYTETVANYKWTFANGGYMTMINVVDF